MSDAEVADPAEAMRRAAITLQALAQTGLHFTDNTYDRERYTQVGEVAATLFRAAGTPAGVVPGLIAGDGGYATPKIDVRAAVFGRRGLLLVREALDENRWTLPGGWADVLESPAGAARREVLEEAGVRVQVRKLAAVLDRELQGHQPPFPYHIYKLFFVCDVAGEEEGRARASGGETTEARFFAADELPDDLSLSRVTPAQLHRMFWHHAHLDAPADYD